MKITDRKYLKEYSELIGNQIVSLISHFDFSEQKGGFDYLTKASAVFSSNIEGNSIDLNSYMNYELSKENFKVGKEIEEIEPNQSIRICSKEQTNRIESSILS